MLVPPAEATTRKEALCKLHSRAVNTVPVSACGTSTGAKALASFVAAKPRAEAAEIWNTWPCCTKESRLSPQSKLLYSREGLLRWRRC